MKRFHLHISVNDLGESIRFYSTLSAAQPTVLQSDCADSQLIQENEQPCCYATLGSIPVYGEDTRVFNHGVTTVPDTSACCRTPTMADDAR
jgi:hypothetical protein